MTGGGDEPRDLAGRIADAWIAFAKNGDPNHTGCRSGRRSPPRTSAR
jgi:hypothetical protein